MHSNDRINPFINREPLKTGGRGPFMQRIRKALGHEAGHVPTELPPEHDESVRQVAAGASREAMVARFVERAKANTMIVERIAGDAAGVLVAIGKALDKHQVTRTILNARGLESTLALPQFLNGRKMQVVAWGKPDCRDEAFTCEASITDCRYGMADSGSVVVWSDAGFGRSSTLVVPVHVILVPASRIVADMVDALQFAHEEARSNGTKGHLPSNIVIINGPSKTADIEMNLVTGVHGPKFLYVLVLEDL